MTQQIDLPTTLRRLQREAQAVAQPLVSEEQESAWERYKRNAEDVLKALIAALLVGKITVREFERAMLQRILQDHTFAYAIAKGGLDLLDDADRLAINARVATQTSYLSTWVAGLSVTGGAVLLGGKAVSTEYMLARAEMYLESGFGSLSESAAKVVGMPRLPAYPRDGTTRCLVRCHCHWYINQVGDADWDAYWIDPLLKEIEPFLREKHKGHCEHCIRRSIAWSPLRIRGGVLQNHIRAGLFL